MTHEDARKNKKPPMEAYAEWFPQLEGADLAQDDHADEIRRRYTYHYNRIYPVLKEGRLDFHQLADKLGFKERRVRETLLFRLTSGEVMQLFGLKDGFCYVCSHRMHIADSVAESKEPVCMRCLEQLDNAIQEMHQSELEAFRTGKAALDSVMGEESSPNLEFGGGPIAKDYHNTVPRAQYEAVLHELKAYRERYGPLGDYVPMPLEEEPLPAFESASELAIPSVIEPVPLELMHGLPSLMPEVSMSEEVALSGALEAESVLEILALSEQEAAVHQESHQILADIEPDDPIRHFGFQRLKTRS